MKDYFINVHESKKYENILPEKEDDGLEEKQIEETQGGLENGKQIDVEDEDSENKQKKKKCISLSRS